MRISLALGMMGSSLPWMTSAGKVSDFKSDYLRRERPFPPSYFFIWVISWLISLAILAFPFFYSLIVDDCYWPENSLLFTIPLSLFVGTFLGVGVNWLANKNLTSYRIF
jgi:hypothetical protein